MTNYGWLIMKPIVHIRRSTESKLPVGRATHHLVQVPPLRSLSRVLQGREGKPQAVVEVQVRGVPDVVGDAALVAGLEPSEYGDNGGLDSLLCLLFW